MNLKSSLQDEVKSAARNGCATKPENKLGSYKSKILGTGGASPDLTEDK